MVVVGVRTVHAGANGASIEAPGIGAVSGEFIALIEAGTTVPSPFAENFATAIEGLDKIMVSLYRGTGERVFAIHIMIFPARFCYYADA